jgi:hypothetical protein
LTKNFLNILIIIIKSGCLNINIGFDKKAEVNSEETKMAFFGMPRDTH